MSNRPEVISQNLKCFLNDEQKVRVAESLARALEDQEALEDEKKQANHGFAERMDGLAKSIKKSCITLSNGYEYKWLDCIVEYNKPKPGEKTLIRKDTGELVRIEEMSFAECQESLPLEPDKPAPDPAQVDALATELFPDRQATPEAPQAIAAAGPDPIVTKSANGSQKRSKRKSRVLATVGKGRNDASRPQA